MHRIWLAIKAFFLVLASGETARRVEPALLPVDTALTKDAAAAAEKPMPAKPAPKTAKPTTSDAIVLLSALQREARFVDFIMESLDGYSDAQVGAVARAVHRDCRTVMERFFGLQPAAKQPEGARTELPAAIDPQQYRVIGQLGQQPPRIGRIVHAGWQATRCELPSWSGSESASRVVAPIEVEVSDSATQ